MSRPARRRLVAAGYLFGAALVALACSTASHTRDLSTGERPWSVQMHLHALSNHNASPNPASMQWHTQFARKSGTEVLWWSEHAEIFAMADTFRLAIGEGELEGTSLRLATGSGHPATGGRKRQISLIEAAVDGDGATAGLEAGYLVAEARADSDGKPSRLAFHPRTAAGRVRNLAFCRPITFGTVVALEVDLGERDAARRAEVRFPLSWHDYGRPIRYGVHYRLASADAAPDTVLTDSGTVVITLPCLDGRSTLRFDLLPAARRLRDGEDATLTDVEWSVEGTGAAPARFGVRSLAVWCESRSAAANVGATRAIASRYQTEYGVHEEIGAEYRWQATHLNAFYPRSGAPAEAFQWTNRPLIPGQVGAWVDSVRARGGIVSLNHPFGTTAGGDDSDEEGDDEPAEAGRVPDLAAALLRDKAHGCDLIEVGYVQRGGATLADHLALWDLLTANRCWLYGNGTSDSHGGPWYGEHNPNWFTTWIWAPDPNADALVAAVRQGRLFFGDQSRWNGVFDFRLDDHRMGDRVAFQPHRAAVKITLDPVPPGASIRLVQGEIGEGDAREVEYVERGLLVDLERPAVLRIERPCFVRLEVWVPGADGGDAPLLFSNPIVFR